MRYLDPPPDFTPLPSARPFIDRNGPFFSRTDSDGQCIVGVRVALQHTNSVNVAHGGFLLAFASFALTAATNSTCLSMTTDFLRPALLGSWLEAKVQIRKRSRNLIFADSLVESDGKIVLRVTGVYKPPRRA